LRTVEEKEIQMDAGLPPSEADATKEQMEEPFGVFAA